MPQNLPSDPSIERSSGPKPTSHHPEAGVATNEGENEFTNSREVPTVLTSNFH